VQQLIGFVQEQVLRPESIKRKEKKQDGRNVIKALRAHYGEEVSDKSSLRESLRKYKKESRKTRAMSIEKFIIGMRLFS
jgi:hypothetical protein